MKRLTAVTHVSCFRWLAPPVLAMGALGLAACEPVDPVEALEGGSDAFVRYECADGLDLALRFDPETDTALVNRSGTTARLERAETQAPGYFYSNGAVSIRGDGTVVRIGMPDAPPVRCSSV